MKYEKGFSLLELIIVVGILAILASLTTMLGVGYFRSASLDQGAGEIILQLRKAQAKAILLAKKESEQKCSA